MILFSFSFFLLALVNVGCFIKFNLILQRRFLRAFCFEWHWASLLAKNIFQDSIRFIYSSIPRFDASITYIPKSVVCRYIALLSKQQIIGGGIKYSLQQIHQKSEQQDGWNQAFEFQYAYNNGSGNMVWYAKSSDRRHLLWLAIRWLAVVKDGTLDNIQSELILTMPIFRQPIRALS